MKVKAGQIWEFANLRCDTVAQYELDRVVETRLSKETAYLRNLETGGESIVTAHWLRQGFSERFNHWRLAEG